MTLWTWQSPGFEIDSEPVNLAKSTMLADRSDLQPKYEAAFNEVGLHPIWCFTEYKHWYQGSDRRVVWELSVPRSAVLAFVDEYSAYELLENKQCPDPTVSGEWCREACIEFPAPINQMDTDSVSNARRKFLQQKLGSYEGRWLSGGSAWMEIFLDNADPSEYVSALLPSPIRPEWVVDRP